MIADYSPEIKIALFQSIAEHQSANKDRSSNCGQIAAKIACFHSLNSKTMGQMLTPFAHNSRIIANEPLKVTSRSANLLSNARAKSKGRSWRRW